MHKVNRIFCIGRNYAMHAQELGNAIPDSPVVFMKPASALIADQTISLPKHGNDLQFEVELVARIGKSGKVKHLEEAAGFISHLALGLDLTLRDLQTQLKNKGLPWEKAKAFDCSATLTDLVPFTNDINLTAIEFTCTVNKQLKQSGNTGDMLFPVDRLLVALSAIWQLQEGDLIYTGTPAGVGSLIAGDEIELWSSFTGSHKWSVG